MKKQRPILFNTEMVQAVLAGRKTQTRRIVKPQPTYSEKTGFHWKGMMYGINSDYAGTVRNFTRQSCPHGRIGDQLWVKETTIRAEDHGYLEPIYVASEDGRAVLDTGLRPAPDDYADVEPHDIKLRPSIFMPKKFARIWLEITDVRVERLQDISEADAEAEGITTNDYAYEHAAFFGNSTPMRFAFMKLWESINGADSWAENPWVWVVSFRVVQGGDL